MRRLCMVLLMIAVTGCSSGPTLGPEQVSPWPLTVGAGTVTCERGISAAKIGLKVDGKHYALSTNAWADKKNYTRVAGVYTGDKSALIRLIEESRRACDVKFTEGPADYVAETIVKP